MTSSCRPILKVERLKVYFPLRRSHPFAPRRFVHAVDDVSFGVAQGKAFGIVGESGSGKTTMALAVMRLIEPTSGRIFFDDVDLVGLKGEALRQMRRRFQPVFQDPYSSLNPRLTVGEIVREPLELMGIGTRREQSARVTTLFQAVGLRPEQTKLFPHQFSGGQRQRIGIARALASHPELIVYDEPVSALDVAIQAQILNLMRRLQREYGLTYLFISHDLGVVQHICDDIVVMYLGRIVERTDRLTLFRKPLHPYTWTLISAVPGLNRKARHVPLSGDPPSPIDLPDGCRFAGRCPFVETRCRLEEPPLRKVGGAQWVACHRVTDEGVAPHHARMTDATAADSVNMQAVLG